MMINDDLLLYETTNPFTLLEKRSFYPSYKERRAIENATKVLPMPVVNTLVDFVLYESRRQRLTYFNLNEFNRRKLRYIKRGYTCARCSTGLNGRSARKTL